MFLSISWTLDRGFQRISFPVYFGRAAWDPLVFFLFRSQTLSVINFFHCSNFHIPAHIKSETVLTHAGWRASLKSLILWIIKVKLQVTPGELHSFLLSTSILCLAFRAETWVSMDFLKRLTPPPPSGTLQSLCILHPPDFIWYASQGPSKGKVCERR